jgi:hypothetical protein
LLEVVEVEAYLATKVVEVVVEQEVFFTIITL